MRLLIMILWAAVHLFAASLRAQESAGPELPPLPPMQEVLDSVERRSHAVQAQEHIVERDHANYKATSDQWAYRIFSDLGYSYANNVNATSIATDNGGFESLSLQNGTVLRAGVTVRLTLYDLIGRPHLKDKAYAEYQASQDRLAAIEQDLRQQAEDLYYELLLSREVVRIRLDLEQTLASSYRMGKEAFRMGETDMDKLSQLAERYARARIATEEARNRYLTLYRKLENMAGFSFS